MNAIDRRNSFDALARRNDRHAVSECLKDFDFHAASASRCVKHHAGSLEVGPRVGNVFYYRHIGHSDELGKRTSRAPADDLHARIGDAAFNFRPELVK